MKVKDCMTRNVVVAEPQTLIRDAAQMMQDVDAGILPVARDGHLFGVVTDRDIVVRGLAKEKDLRGMSSREIASGELITVRPDQDLSDALHLMAQHQVRRLPVVDDQNRLVGVVSQADIALEARDQSVGEMVAEISKPAQGAGHL